VGPLVATAVVSAIGNGAAETRAARNVVIVATANKLARISWAVLASGQDYHPMHIAVSSAS
jgi:hypothetical protein